MDIRKIAMCGAVLALTVGCGAGTASKGALPGLGKDAASKPKASSLPKPNLNQPWSVNNGILAYVTPGGVEVVNLKTPSVGHLVKLGGYIADVQVSIKGTVGIVVGNEGVFFQHGKTVITPDTNGLLWAPDGSLVAWEASNGFVLYSPAKNQKTIIPDSWDGLFWASDSQVDYINAKGEIDGYNVQSKTVTTLERTISAYRIETVGGGRVFFFRGVPGTQPPAAAQCMMLEAEGKVTRIGPKDAISCWVVGVLGNQVLLSTQAQAGPAGSATYLGPPQTQLVNLTSGQVLWSLAFPVAQIQMIGELVALNAQLDPFGKHDQLQIRDAAKGTLVARYDLAGSWALWQGEKSGIWYLSATSSGGIKLNELTVNGGKAANRTVLFWH